MKVIIAGSRMLTDFEAVDSSVKASGFDISELVSGGAPGVDAMGERWARLHGVPVKRFPADWLRYGRRAGPIRNREMARHADALIALWDGKSRGTRSMIQEARRRGLKVFVYRISVEEGPEVRERQSGWSFAACA